MTRAEFFNAKLTGQPITDALSVRLADQLGAKSEPKGQNLAQRITVSAFKSTHLSSVDLRHFF